MLIGIALWAVLRPARPNGVLAASAGATWEDAAHSPRAGQPLPVQPLNLKSGLAQMRLDNGVSLIVEGPAQFEIQSQNTVALTVGKITVTVPPNAHGFAVVTPSARTVDLGTEFGVSVDASGKSETHVIRGTVEITPIAGGDATRLTAGNATRVEFAATETQKIPFQAGSFVQDVPAIDLVDVLSGGDGTQRRCDSGIDIGDGRILPLPADVRVARSRDIEGDELFHPVAGRPLIGGVFIPHGGPGPDTLDAAGHQFTFPTTTNHAYNDLWPRDLATLTGVKSPTVDVIGNIDYSAPGHRLLVLHANKGISYDLDALRKAHPDRPFSHLQAVCVNLNANASPTGGPISDRSEFWVFVDGDLRSHKLIHRTDPPFDVDVPIEAAAHSLTLAATDGGDGFDWDVVSLGDPRLN